MGTEPSLARGTLCLGCNYWASHAGTNMWRRWDSDTVESDLALLGSHELRVIRIFPLWPDFRPIVALVTGYGQGSAIACR